MSIDLKMRAVQKIFPLQEIVRVFWKTSWNVFARAIQNYNAKFSLLSERPLYVHDCV